MAQSKTDHKPDLRRYFFDTEFNDTAPGFIIDFISIGIVNEQGEGYYGISNTFNVAAAQENTWIRDNVLNKLDHHATWKTIETIKAEIIDMIEPAREIEFWAKNGSYDNVLLCQIFGGMGNLRNALQKAKGIEKITFRDTKEVLRVATNPHIEPMPEDRKHISINDAHNERYVFTQCQKAIASQNRPKPDVI